MSNTEGIDDNQENPYENKTPSTPSSASPVSDDDVEITFVDAFPNYNDVLFQLRAICTFGVLYDKFGHFVEVQLPTASEREAIIRREVFEFFRTYLASNPQSAARTLNSDCLGRPSSIIECAQSLTLTNFFSSRRTRCLRERYRDSFTSFEDLMDPRSVNSLTYKSEMQTRYIPFPLIRILLEDILDFVDFFEGTEVPQTCPLGISAEELQLARIRDEFENGVQQIEFDVIHNLENDLNGFILQSPPKENRDPLTLEITQCSESKPVSPPRTRRLYQEAPELDQINDARIHVTQLRSIQDVIESLVISLITRLAEILNYCKETKISNGQDDILLLISTIKEQLHELKDLRTLCTRLLARMRDKNNPLGIMFVLKVKVKTAIVFKGILIHLRSLFQSFSFQKE